MEAIFNVHIIIIIIIILKQQYMGKIQNYHEPAGSHTQIDQAEIIAL